MKIYVNTKELDIKSAEIILTGEINTAELEFEFSSEWESLEKVAVFSTPAKTYREVIRNNKCAIPCFEVSGKIVFGVYGYVLSGEQKTLQYSPAPIYINVKQGSFAEAEEQESITPSDYERFIEEFKNWALDEGIKGEPGPQGPKGDTGAQGIQGVPGTNGTPGKDGVGITGVTVSLDDQNRRVFTFTMSDGTTRDVILPGEVITITHDEQSASMSVEEFAQGISDSLFFFERGINNLKTTKADKTALVYECDVQMQGDDAYIIQEDIDALYRLKPAVLKVNIYAEGVFGFTQLFTLLSSLTVPDADYESLIYQQYLSEMSADENNFVKIKIPKSAENPVISENVIFQEKIDSNHKLSADAVDDTNSVHKFVTAVEKEI